MKFYGTTEEVEDINGYILVDGFLNPKNNHIIIKTCPVCGMSHQHGNDGAVIGELISRLPHCGVGCKFEFFIKLVGTISTTEESKLRNRKRPSKIRPEIVKKSLKYYTTNKFLQKNINLEYI